MTRRFGRVGCVVLLLLLLQSVLFARPAAAWWNSDWSNRMKVTADAGPKGAGIAEPIGRTQILVRLHSGNFNFAAAKEDGSDLRIVAADDRTPLHFHLEKYDGLIDQVGLVWVDVPDLAPGAATTFYIYFGNKNAPVGGDPKATYSPDNLLVYHFATENGLPVDTTAYGNNALTPGKRDDGGMIGFGLKLDGTAPVQVPPSPSLAMTEGQATSWSTWFRFADPAANSGVLFSAREGGNALIVGLDKGVAYAQADSATGSKRTSDGAPAAGDGWHFLAVTAGDGKLTVYVDGEARGDVAAVLPAMNGALLIGGASASPVAAAPAAAPPTPAPPTPAPAASAVKGGAPAAPAPVAAAPAAAPPPAAAGPNFVGLIDEFHVTRGILPVGAMKVAVKSAGPSPNLLAFDVAEESSVLGTGYLSIIVRSVTPDAWVVIGLLGLMMLISWAVMLGKTLYIGGANKANRAFRAEFARAAARTEGDPRLAFQSISADKRPILRRSPLYRLYEIGARELRARQSDGRLPPGGALSPQSLAAIRSSMEAGLSRESQRFNRLMVLLTIAISGGPFLGLLGTVVGVMITFAAIAAAGDVNVNSIAPGIAAALLATVAGLAVAIPALFGYNYLLTRIRDTTNEMNVFVDDMMTRMAEGFRSTTPAAQVADLPLRGTIGGADMDALVDALLIRLTDSIRGLRPQPGE